MVNALKKTSDTVNKVYLYIAFLFLFLLIFSSGVQVFTRYVLNNSQSWTEEAARYSFIYFTMFGSACAVKLKAHAAMDFLPNILKGKAKFVHEVIVNIILLICSVLLIWQGLIVVKTTWFQFSPAMHFPMGVAYLSVPLGAVGMLVHLVFFLAEQLFGGYSAAKEVPS